MTETTDPSLDRYAEAARRVDAGDACDGCSAGDGPFGAGNYDDLAGLPDAAVRVSLGCGNPIAVADLQPGDTVLDLGSGGGIDVLLSARRVGPTGFAYGLDATVEMLELARRNAAEAGATNVEFLHGTHRADPARATPRSTSSSRTASSSCPATRTPRSPRSPGSCAPAVVSGSATSSAPGPTTAHRPASRAAPARSRPPPTRTPCGAPGSATCEVTLTDAIGAGLSNADHPGRQAGRRRSARCATRTGRRCGTSTRPGSPPATPPSRPRRRAGSAGTPATSPTTASSPPTTTSWSAGPP